MWRDKKIERYFQTEVLTRAAGEIVYPVSTRKKKRLSVTLAMLPIASKMQLLTGGLNVKANVRMYVSPTPI